MVRSIKTEMTRSIEQAILVWHPVKVGDITINKFRGEHTALEVPVVCGTTEGGIVDAVRVSEYFGDKKKRGTCRVESFHRMGYDGAFECPRGYERYDELPHFCDEEVCRNSGYVWTGEAKILITCFEIKVTKSDFKSSHGHNFVGNMNYYVVPNELYKEILPLVPEDIGVLSYHHEGYYVGLRAKKKATYRDMTDEDQKWLMLSTFKRIRDMDYKRSLEDMKTGGEWL